MKNKSYLRVSGMLGFAQRAGKLVIGTDLVCRALAKNGRGRVELVLVASDASDGTQKKVYSKCEFYKTEVYKVELDSSELGKLLGKTFAPVTVGVKDEGFAFEIKKAITAKECGDNS